MNILAPYFQNLLYYINRMIADYSCLFKNDNYIYMFLYSDRQFLINNK